MKSRLIALPSMQAFQVNDFYCTELARIYYETKKMCDKNPTDPYWIGRLNAVEDIQREITVGLMHDKSTMFTHSTIFYKPSLKERFRDWFIARLSK